MEYNPLKWNAKYWRILGNFLEGFAGFLGGASIQIRHVDLILIAGICKLLSHTCFDIAKEKEKKQIHKK